LTQIHFKRKNIFEEKEAIIKENKDLPGILQSQIEFYQSQGFGRNLLLETNFFIANLKNNKTKELFRLWNEQINKYSHRDQISLPYIIDQLKIEEFYLIDDPKKIARFNENHFLFSNHSYKNNYGKSEFKFKFIENFFRKKIEFKICEKSVDVIIPVFNALTYVQKLLKSITLNYYNPSINFIIVNDGSNSETSHFLNNFANNHQNFKIVNNKQNLGYTRSINIGLKHNKSDYKIILNSDTEVNKDWIDYLLLPFQNKKIHIAGPLSNAASYQSVPKVSENSTWIVNNKIKDFQVINKLLLEKFQFEYPALSHINGFCMAIKQEVFDNIGYFDEELFKQGYGEENDFCWRAIDAGYNVVLNHHCYIYHAKTKSFNLKEKEQLIKNSNKILNEKFGTHRIQNLNESFNQNFFLEHIRHNLD
jgi:GT2 family glycosyltransferase